jgi:hypothetical protein
METHTISIGSTQAISPASARTNSSANPVLYLCAGLQGSGSTLVSWCFLQRSDLRGVLDGTFDLVPALPAKRAGEAAWYKTTIACFRLAELAEHYADFGWQVRPLLVVRDVRQVWASLVSKPYGRNGTTAEDPPLRLRFRRFLADWRLFRAQHLPTIRFESLLAAPETTLRRAASDLDLAWDPGMLSWPKPAEELGGQPGGSATFLHSRGSSLQDTLNRQNRPEARSARVAADDWHWLEYTFAEFNEVCGYPPQLPCSGLAPPPGVGGRPSFAATRRYRWETNRKPWRRLLSLLGIPNRRLIESRSVENLL